MDPQIDQPSGTCPHTAMLQSAFILTVQALPCTLLLLLGWGFGNLPAFFLDPARAVLVANSCAGAVAAILLKLDLNPIRKGAVPSGKESAQLGALLIMSLALLWFLPHADRRNVLTLHHEHWRYLGLLFFSIGVAVRIAALKSLGEHFSAYVTLQPNHRLVQDGIYAHIRHPLYLSLLLIPTGIALVFASWLALPILILAALFILDRIRKEERLLAEHFGVEFEYYRTRISILIPFLF
jgi:protein-S-isoprenylcysteine O-methyltransferase Ste14